KVGTAKGTGLVLQPIATEEAEVDSFAWILVGEVFDQLTDDDLDAEFLAKLANQALLERFTGLEFTTRELPKSAQMRVVVPERDQELAFVEDQTGGDVDGHT